MTEPSLKIVGYTMPNPIARNYEGKVIIPFVLSRDLNSMEQRLTTTHEINDIQATIYRVPVEDVTKVADIVAELNIGLAALEKAAVEASDKARRDRERIEHDARSEHERIRAALKDSGLEEIDPRLGKPSQDW